MAVDARSANDAELMARISKRDQAAFRAFVDRHLSRILAVAQRVSGNRSDAEEIAQDALLRVWRHAVGHAEDRAHAGTWLHRIVVNLAIDCIRRRPPTPLSIGDGADLEDPQPDAEKVAEGHELGTLMRAAIERLPLRQRKAVSLCFFNGLDCAEAARAMHVSVSAMESLLVRGRRTLRKQFAVFRVETAI